MSWAGLSGCEAARTLASSLSETFEQLKLPVRIVFSPMALDVGGDWRSQLQHELAGAAAGVAIIDPRALRSPWVAFEMGCVFARSNGNPRIFPVLLAEEHRNLNTSPFELVNCAHLNQDSFCALLSGLVDAVGGAVNGRPVDELAARCLRAVTDCVRDAHAEPAGRREHELIGLLREIIDEHRTFGQISAQAAAELSSLVMSSREFRFDGVQATSLISELAETSRLFEEIAVEGNGRFATIATEAVLRRLQETTSWLRHVSLGELPLENHPAVRAFWVDSIFGGAQESIWTTYVNKPGYTMGGEHDRQLLDAQAAAIDRGVKVTRMFVHPETMDDAEILERRQLMRSQLEVGVEVCTLVNDLFGAGVAAHRWVAPVGSPDFMIIDESLVYLTFPRGEGLEARLVSGFRQPERLEAARRFRDELASYARWVSLDDVEQFPALDGGV